MALGDALAACGVDLDRAVGGDEVARRGGRVPRAPHRAGARPARQRAAGAAVSGTFGVERHLITFTGQAAHAGSTPMRLRQDSLAAAARAALEIRESAIAHGGVGTVGRMDSTPGRDHGGRRAAPRCSWTSATSIRTRWRRCWARPSKLPRARRRRSTARSRCTTSSGPPRRRSHPARRDRAGSVADAGGGDGEPIPSGPLHDATEIGRVVPTAMIFAQSDPPISHAPIEDSSEQRSSVAIDAYGRTVDRVHGLIHAERG